MTNEMVARREGQAVATTAVTPMQMLQIAVEKGTDIDQLTKLMDLSERWEANQARRAYVEAMTRFKSNPPEIRKTKHVNIPRGATFAHATLAEIVDAVCQSLSSYGLSHRWETDQSNGMVTVTCVITHELGHSERTTLSASPDASGSKNSIQQIASTVTYLQRYTLLAATGLAAKDMDDDGVGAGPRIVVASEKDIAQVRDMIEATGANREAFLKWLGVPLEEMTKQDHQRAMRALKAKAKESKE